MKQKRIAALLLAAVLCALLAGCGGEKTPTPGKGTENTQTQPQTSKAPTAQTPALDEREAARAAYLDFLNGNGTVKTSEAFRQDSESDDYAGDTPDYGSYCYEELKYDIADGMMGDNTASYTFLDLSEDGGAELLALRFNNEDPSFYNWTGIIRYDDGELTLTYSYIDGYRTYAELYTSGFLRIGGSGGAGEYDENAVLLQEDGTAKELYASSEYWGSFVPCVRYQMDDPPSEMMGEEYFHLPLTFCARTYSDENGLRVFVEETASDPSPEALALEEAFVNELTQWGLAPVEWETFRGLLDWVAEYETQEVTWIDFEDGLPPYYNAEVTACYPENWWYICNPDHEEVVLDTSEYAVPVALETTKPVTEFQVVSLDITDVTDSGLVCATQELYSRAEFTPEEPLLITLAFPGDLPTYGVKFVDIFGEKRLFTFSQSGMDGSLIFEEAELAYGE